MKIWTAIFFAFGILFATKLQAASIIDAALIAKEAAVIKSFQEKIEKISKKETTINQRREISIEMKKNIHSLKGSLTSFIQKLKSNNKWNKDFDIAIERELSNMDGDQKAKQTLINFIKDKGGARSTLLFTIENIDNLSQELDEDIRNTSAQSKFLNFDIVSSAHAAIRMGYKCALVATAGVVAGASGCVGCAFGAGLWMLANCV